MFPMFQFIVLLCLTKIVEVCAIDKPNVSEVSHIGMMFMTSFVIFNTGYIYVLTFYIYIYIYQQ